MASFSGRKSKFHKRVAYLDPDASGGTGEYVLTSEYKGDPYWMHKRALNYSLDVGDQLRTFYKNSPSVRVCVVEAASADRFDRHLRYVRTKAKIHGDRTHHMWWRCVNRDGSHTFLVPAQVRDTSLDPYPTLHTAEVVEPAIYSILANSDDTQKITANGDAPPMKARSESKKLALGFTSDEKAFDRVVEKAKEIGRGLGLRILATKYDTSRYLSWRGDTSSMDEERWAEVAGELRLAYSGP